MTETSFPVVEKPLTEDQWATIAHGFGQGIIDQGGYPYNLGPIDDVTDEVTILVDVLTGKNEAIVRGFVHSIDEPKKLHLPAVSSTTTYEIGLVYDPLNHGTAAGPVRLDVWTAPGDTTGNKVRIVLYRITRQPSTALSTAAVVSNKQRISPQITVSATADLPPTSAVLVDTTARVRITGEMWAATINPTTGVVGWQKVSGSRDPELAAATWEADPNTIVKRAGNGGTRVITGTNDLDAVNVRWVWDNSTGGTSGSANKLVRRDSNGFFLVPDPTAANHPASRGWSEGRYFRPATELLDGTRLNKNGGDVWWEIISGSTNAYATAQSGQVYTVSVNSSGRFMRFTSKRADKDNIEPLRKDVRAILAPEVVEYQRRDPDTGEVEPGARVEWGFIADDELVREDGTPELVLTEPDEDGTQQPEGWDNYGLTAAHHKVLQWLAARVDLIDAHLGIDTEGAGA